MSKRDKRLDSVNKPRSAEFWKEVPPRWMNCPPVGNIVADLFLPFKTPLGSTYESRIPTSKRFGVEDVFDETDRQEKSIALWVDLTNTDRFYNKADVSGLHSPTVYVKSPCSGHGECPSAEQVSLFIKLCEKHYRRRPDSLIGIHCTHGFNRTGFLICAYLVEVLDWSFGCGKLERAERDGSELEVQPLYSRTVSGLLSAAETLLGRQACAGPSMAVPAQKSDRVDAAIDSFANARPPGIYKSDYLEAFYERYHADPEDQRPAPELPSWCFEEDDDQLDDDGNQLQPEDEDAVADDPVNDEPVSKKRRKEPRFMEGVPGIEWVSDPTIYKRVQAKCKAVCRSKNPAFPGCQPVSMDLDNKELLKHNPYRVSWKADGVRYMLLIDGKDQVFFVDRNNDVFLATGMTFPYERFSQSIENTLLDGEMIIENVAETGGTRPRFLVYDIVHFMNEYVGKMDFDSRRRYITKRVIGPRDFFTREGRLVKDREPFSIRAKEFWPVKALDRHSTPARVLYANNAAKYLREEFTKSLGHEVDGLIFQPLEMPYIAGRCDYVLKWKPPNQCTVDFKLQIEKLTGRGIISKQVGKLYVGGCDVPFGELKLPKDSAQLNGKILECKYDSNINKWIFDRVRTDKNTPNHFTTAQSVFKGIRNPLTKEILLNFIDQEVPYFEEEVAKRTRNGQASSMAAGQLSNGAGLKRQAESSGDEHRQIKR